MFIHNDDMRGILSMFWGRWTGNAEMYPLYATGARRRRMSTQAVIITFAKNLHHVASIDPWSQISVPGITPHCKLAILERRKKILSAS